MHALLEHQLLKELDLRLGDKGFTRQSDRFYGHRYDLAVDGGRKSLALASHKRKRALILDPAFASVRLDEVEDTVFRFEEKNELIGAQDALQRNTTGLRLDKNELLNVMTGRYTIATEEDCERVGDAYAQQMLDMADKFWKSVSSPDAILAKLAVIRADAYKHAATDVSAAMRAIVLTRMLHGTADARRFADEVAARLSGKPSLDLHRWMTRAFEAWT